MKGELDMLDEEDVERIAAQDARIAALEARLAALTRPPKTPDSSSTPPQGNRVKAFRLR